MRSVSLALWQRMRAALAIIAIGIVSYSNTFQVPFLLDDSARIVHNPKIRTLIPTVGSLETNRPVVDYTFALNYAMHGLELWGYHAVNLAIHLAGALCLYGIVRRSLLRVTSNFTSNAEMLGLAVAMIWVAHPLQTQAVTYINQRYESLMGLAFLAALYTLIRSFGSRRPGVWRIASVSICAIGMGCKEAMVSAPFVILWYDRAFVARSWSELFRARHWYYAALGATWGVLAWSMLHFTGEYTGGGMGSVAGVTPWTYLLSQSAVIVHYLSLAVWPLGQCFWDKWPVAQTIADICPQGLAVVALLGGTIWAMFRAPKIGFLGGWFFLILAPTSSVVPIRDLMFEHRMYLPLAALSCIFVLGINAIANRFPIAKLSPRLSRAMIYGLAIISLSMVTHQRNEVYRSEVAIWQDTVVKSPRHADAWHNLGLAYLSVGRSAESLVSLREANRLASDNPQINSSLGAGLMQVGKYEEAKSHLMNAIEHAPHDSLALRNMGNAMLDTGQSSEAIGFLERALLLSPSDTETQLSLAAAYGMNDRFVDSISQSNLTLLEHPENSQAHFNLMSVYTQMGQYGDAIEQGNLSVDANPNDALCQGRLGMLLASTLPDQAIEHLEIACRLDSTIEEFQFILGILLILDQPEKAIPHFLALVELNPNNVEARRELVQAYTRTGQEKLAEQERQKIKGIVH